MHINAKQTFCVYVCCMCVNWQYKFDDKCLAKMCFNSQFKCRQRPKTKTKEYSISLLHSTAINIIIYIYTHIIINEAYIYITMYMYVYSNLCASKFTSYI